MVSGKRAFTIVELLIAAVCVSLLAGILFSILKTGTDSSLRGMLKVDTVLEAQTIIQQLHQDLKNACLPLSASETLRPQDLAAENIVRINDEGQSRRFTLFVFPLQGEVADFLGPLGEPGQTDSVRCRLSKVVYSLAPGIDGPPSLSTLTRTEFFHPEHPLARNHPAGLKTVLSKRVNFLLIHPRQFPLKRSSEGGDEAPENLQTCFRITLQIAESYPKSDPVPSTSEGSWAAPNPHLIVADFFDVVYSEFFNQWSNRFPSNRNWYVTHSWPQGQ